MENFKADTIDPSIFIIEDVACDGACMFRSIANGLIHDFKVNTGWSYSGKYQTILAKKLQKIALKYIFENEEEIIPELEITLKQCVEMVHKMSFDDYIYNYQYFAGKHYADLKERWGGFPEQYALSKILDCPIHIYTPQKWNPRSKRINIGKIIKNKAEKNVRFRLCQVISKDAKNQPIYLLWKKTKNGDHYYALYKK